MANIEMKKMVCDHVDERIYHMSPDETYTFEWLLGESILAATTELERVHMERMLNTLIVCGETNSDLIVAGLNEEGRTLYTRME
jgi:hypothetical protein